MYLSFSWVYSCYSANSSSCFRLSFQFPNCELFGNIWLCNNIRALSFQVDSRGYVYAEDILLGILIFLALSLVCIESIFFPA